MSHISLSVLRDRVEQLNSSENAAVLAMKRGARKAQLLHILATGATVLVASVVLLAGLALLAHFVFDKPSASPGFVPTVLLTTIFCMTALIMVCMEYGTRVQRRFHQVTEDLRKASHLLADSGHCREMSTLLDTAERHGLAVLHARGRALYGADFMLASLELETHFQKTSPAKTVHKENDRLARERAACVALHARVPD